MFPTPLAAAHRRDAIEALRARIGAIESGSDRAAPMRTGATAPLGIAVIDRALPWGGLPRGALHEITAGGAGGVEDERAVASGRMPRRSDRGRIVSEALSAATGAATAFTALVAGRLCGADGQALWCLRRGDLYAPGLPAFGIDPQRLLVVRAARPKDVSWTLEEALGCGRFSVVVGEGANAGRIATRRLQRAACVHGTACLLLDRGGAAGSGADAAVTRWRIAAAPGERSSGGGPATTGWQVALMRCRGGGAPRCWTIQWCHETRDFIVAAPLADRSSRSARPAA